MKIGQMQIGQMKNGGKKLCKTLFAQAAPRRFSSRFAWMLIACLAFAVYPSPHAHSQSIRFEARAVVEDHLRSFSAQNREREARIRQWLAEAGCKPANLSEQAISKQTIGRELPPNVICVLPGQTPETIVVGAHTDHVDAGDGVVDNWTGAVLLPALLYSLSAHSRHHTLIFIGFSAEESNLTGSRYYAAHLTRAQRARIEAVVNFDSLGLGPTEVWASHADKTLFDALQTTARAAKLPLTVMNPERGASADSESFAPYRIPRITLHSVTEQTWPILHSPSDNLDAVKTNDYYDSYKLIAKYLAYLDNTLKPEKR